MAGEEETVAAAVRDMLRGLQAPVADDDLRAQARQQAQQRYALDRLMKEFMRIKDGGQPLDEHLQQPITEEQRRRLADIFSKARTAHPGGGRVAPIPTTKPPPPGKDPEF